MADDIQASRSVAVSGDFTDKGLVFSRLVMEEELGRPYRCEVDLLSQDTTVAFDDLLGQNMTIRLEIPDGETRLFNGFVTRFSMVGTQNDAIHYRAELRPWLWFLTQTADCRIFQEMTAAEIILQVFRDQGFTDFDDRLSETYRTREYCVQYRESDFDFVSRLMEEEGISYYFLHEQGKNVLVLADGISSHEAVPGYQELPYYPPEDSSRRERDHVYGWEAWQEVCTGTFAHTDFDFTASNADLQSKGSIAREHALSNLEIFDYPGGYTDSADGEQYAKVRIQEAQAQQYRKRGAGNARGLMAGALFSLTGFPRDDQNVEHLVILARHVIEAEDYRTGDGAGTGHYRNEFMVLPSTEPFRTRSTTPKPVVRGPQTAMVVGKSGEEIWTDEFGRVKVQFHWDRYGAHDENSSCWIRVAQISAGKGWGALFVPRIGQEVIVEFLEGDPDRPIITGRVYNGQSTVPYELPSHATRSTIKTNSSKGGGGFNEIRFEDKKDSEQIFIHSQRNTDVRTGNNSRERVGNDQHLTVGNDQFSKVENDRHAQVVGDEFSTVTGDQNNTLEANRKTSVGESDHLTITTDSNTEVGGDSNLTTGGDHNHEVTGQFSLDAGDVHAKAGTAVALEGGQTVHIKGGMGVVVEGGTELTLKVGGSFVKLSPAGVDIKGPLVNINSGGSAGSGDGCSPNSPATPEAPDESEEALLPEEGEAGEVDEPHSGESKEHEAVELSSQAVTLMQARQNESAFCEECEAAGGSR